MYFPIEAPDGSLVYPIGPTGYESRWICNPDGYEYFKKENRIYWKQVETNGEKKWQVYQKFYLEDKKKAVSNLWSDLEGNKKATRDIRDLFLDDDVSFDFPKPVGLVKRIIEIGNDDNAIVLDFFSGSATTAHAAMQLNSEDGGCRKYIMVQLPEKIDDESKNGKTGYKTICDIGEERIRRAGRKIKEESPLTTQNLDIGFRCFGVDSSNMKDVYYKPSEYGQMNLDSFMDNIKDDRTPEDLLIQVMLDLSVLLSSKIDQTEIAGRKVFSVADGYLIACFDKNITDETVTEIAQRHPFYAVFRDSSMASDSVAVNFEQIFETYSPNTVRKVL